MHWAAVVGDGHLQRLPNMHEFERTGWAEVGAPLMLLHHHPRHPLLAATAPRGKCHVR